MFTEEESKEIKGLSESVRNKIYNMAALFEKVKKSHHFSTYMTIYNQKMALQSEMDLSPFLIRGCVEDIEISENGIVNDSGIKNAIKEALTSRQNVETAMKFMKLLPELDDILERTYIKMTTDEKQKVEREKAGEAESILHLHLKNNGKK